MGEHKHDYIEMVMCSHCENERIFTATETNARLERERDEATNKAALVGNLLTGVSNERDAARADAARMRLALGEAVKHLPSGHQTDDLLLRRVAAPGYDPEVVALLEARAALAPDDGWLARRIEEAVAPYREALQEVNDQVEMRRELGRGDTRKVQAIVDRALLGGTPTKEGE